MQKHATPPILTPHIKVLHIISGDLWAGAEVQAFTLLCALKHHCDLHVVLMNNGELANKLKHANISIEIIDEQHISGIGIIGRLIKVIKAVNPDVIHTHRQKENILASIANLAANLFPWRRITSLRTTHGAPEHKPQGLKRLIVWLDDLTGKYAQDAVIAVSKDLAHKLTDRFPPKHIHIIENGIDNRSLAALTPASDIRTQAEEHIHIGIVGRLEPVKRVDLFIQTASQLLHSHPKYKLKFHVIGDGKLKNELTIQAQQLGLGEAMIFHGHRTDSTAAIAALDIIVMCSDHEGTPMTALETLALGKPLVAHSVGGLREVLADYPQLLVTEHSVNGYSETLLQLFEHPIKTQLNTTYTSEENARRTLQLYFELNHRNVE
ncbi:glycosyltransferase [Cellvibrio sp. pealriver]|uniref:glycosyltransferase n=1 Tax=Cellvibrio sp. pealriver TaxID=1622269 RepID=UPI0009E30F35|nr:glycosyltransferase [Cellvibrio sp. pealriver]